MSTYSFDLTLSSSSSLRTTRMWNDTLDLVGGRERPGVIRNHLLYSEVRFS